MSEAGQGQKRKRQRKPVELPWESRCKRFNGIPKASYRSKAKARKALRQHTNADRKLYVYCCPRCGLWHVTGEAPRV